jgi:preprotein translocase subunit SecF
MAKDLKARIINVFDKHYRVFMIICLSILVLSIFQIAFQTYTTGSFIHKGISLKGGISFTVLDTKYDSKALEKDLAVIFPENEIEVSSISSLGDQKGLVVNLDTEDRAKEEQMNSELERITGSNQITIKRMGSALAEGFFKEVIVSLIIGFIFMSVVVFFLFKTFIPSVAVIVSAITDIIVPIAITNVLGIKISTAGIAAFLMLIGYSVDTDIVLTTRVVKNKDGLVIDRVLSAFKTGIMMTVTSIATVTVGLLMSNSSVLKEIFTILLIGLIVDIPSTWMQNVGILRLYLEHKSKDKKKTN